MKPLLPSSSALREAFPTCQVFFCKLILHTRKEQYRNNYNCNTIKYTNNTENINKITELLIKTWKRTFNYKIQE